MNVFENFSVLFVEVWQKGILGIDIFQILIGLGIFLIFLLFRGFISKIIINRLKKIAKKTTNKLDDTFVQAMEGPARFFPIVIGFLLPVITWNLVQSHNHLLIMLTSLLLQF